MITTISGNCWGRTFWDYWNRTKSANCKVISRGAGSVVRRRPIFT
jgi:hypothetical protein